MRLNAEQRHPVRFTLNGRAVEAEAEPRMLLTDFIRHELGLTGTHVGCEHGVCGACTIEIDGVPARACLTLAVQADGGVIRTVEALAPAAGTPFGCCRRRFAGITPCSAASALAGILMSLDNYLRNHSDPSEAELRNFLSGHLCRCTGYTPIIAAALDAARRLREALVRCLISATAFAPA